MGSSSKRKQHDTLYINQPIQKTDGTGARASSGGASTPPDMNMVCPVKFWVKLKRQDIIAGIKLKVVDREIEAPGIGVVGKINSAILKRLQTCFGIGFSYSAVSVIDKKGVRHAEFSHS